VGCFVFDMDWDKWVGVVIFRGMDYDLVSTVDRVCLEVHVRSFQVFSKGTAPVERVSATGMASVIIDFEVASRERLLFRPCFLRNACQSVFFFLFE